MSREVTEFVIYIIHAVVEKQDAYPSHVYRVLEKTDCIGSYLVPFYDVLHTLSTERVAEDVLAFVKARGAVI